MIAWLYRLSVSVSVSLGLGLALLGAGPVRAQSQDLTPAEIEAAVATVNAAQNRAMLATTTPEDVERLFALYSPQFVYEHAVYGGSYSREQLKANTLRNLAAGRYTLTEGRYQIRRIIPGLRAAAVERLELVSGQLHLSVFEFDGDKVRKISEYWR
ncbi:UNVERIFIED_ORG: hypothetical protein LHJ69_19700 [Shinella sp. XGS7]|nr:hypothetical protein [Shinella sp. XGS7]